MSSELLRPSQNQLVRATLFLLGLYRVFPRPFAAAAVNGRRSEGMERLSRSHPSRVTSPSLSLGDISQIPEPVRQRRRLQPPRVSSSQRYIVIGFYPQITARSMKNRRNLHMRANPCSPGQTTCPTPLQDFNLRVLGP